MGTLKVYGKSGSRYHFKFYPLDIEFQKNSGLILVSKREKSMEGGHSHQFLFLLNQKDVSVPIESHIDFA